VHSGAVAGQSVFEQQPAGAVLGTHWAVPGHSL
jgi:hypothetical protein